MSQGLGDSAFLKAAGDGGLADATKAPCQGGRVTVRARKPAGTPYARVQEESAGLSYDEPPCVLAADVIPFDLASNKGWVVLF